MASKISSQEVAALRARMRACLDEMDRLGLSLVSQHMDYAITRLDAAFPPVNVDEAGEKTIH